MVQRKGVQRKEEARGRSGGELSGDRARRRALTACPFTHPPTHTPGTCIQRHEPVLLPRHAQRLHARGVHAAALQRLSNRVLAGLGAWVGGWVGNCGWAGEHAAVTSRPTAPPPRRTTHLHPRRWVLLSLPWPLADHAVRGAAPPKHLRGPGREGGGRRRVQRGGDARARPPAARPPRRSRAPGPEPWWTACPRRCPARGARS